jgi:hypothetical protein
LSEKPSASGYGFSSQQCAKTRLGASEALKKLPGALPPGPPGKEPRKAKGKGRGRENGGEEGNGKGGVKEREGELGSKAIGDLEVMKKRREGRDRG